MGSNSNGEFGFEQSSGISPPASNFPICSGFLVSHSEASAGIAAAGSTDSCLKAASCSPLEMIEPFSACWDCLVPMNGHAGFRGKMSSNGHQEQLYQLNMTPRINLAGYHSNVRLVGSAPSFSCLLNGRYPDNMSNYSLLDSTTISTVAPNNHHLSSPNQGIRIDQSAANTSSRTLVYIKEFEGIDQGIADQEVEQNGESRIVSSPLDTRKRKRMPDGIASDLNQDFDHAQRNLLFCCPWWRNESDQSKDASHLSNDSMKMKKEEDASDSPTKLNVRQNKDQNQNAEAQKEEYIHVRARRGQATNSHSLAERVRREKISERMRFLQDLVPGCNKVTGKAVMLDEIINYVLSLQCQVEFLSMKLATVNPDFNVGDIVLKNIFSSEGRSSAVLGFAPNVNPSCHTVSGYPLESIEPGTEAVHDIKNFGDTLRSMNPQFDQMEQVPNAWDNELQNVVQMGFVSPANIRIPPKDGNLKVDN